MNAQNGRTGAMTADPLSDDLDGEERAPGAAQSIVITIPTDLPAALSPNARVHWRRKHEATSLARNAAWYATISVPWPDDLLVGRRLRIDATISWAKGRKRMDEDNARAMLKSCLDGVADALNRNDKDFTMGTLVQDRDKEGRGSVVLVVSSLP